MEIYIKGAILKKSKLSYLVANDINSAAYIHAAWMKKKNGFAHASFQQHLKEMNGNVLYTECMGYRSPLLTVI